MPRLGRSRPRTARCGARTDVTFGSLIRGALLASFTPFYPLGTLHSITRTESPDGDVTETPTDIPIRVQREPATESMRRAAGYTDKDVALIVLQQPGLDVSTNDQVTDGEGNLWAVASAEFDAAESHWVLRGSPA